MSYIWGICLNLALRIFQLRIKLTDTKTKQGDIDKELTELKT